MLVAALIFLIVAAAGGIFLAYLHLTGKNAPIPLAVVHGILAVIGVILLLIGMSAHALAIVALIGFILAALGGIVLFSMHMRMRPLPRALIGVHGGVAVLSWIILLIFVIRVHA